MIENNKLYNFKSEFAKELGIPNHQVDRKLDDLLIWLTNFYDYEFTKGHPHKIFIKEVIGEYQPLPRKLPKQNELTAAKKKKYKDFTIASLGVEFKPNSQSKIAREAIAAFGYEKFAHTSTRAVAARYIKEPMRTYGESDNRKVWVWYSSYDPLDEEVVSDWRNILNKHKIGEKEAAKAFYRQEQGEDITEEKNYYQNALKEFKRKYGDIAVLVCSWRLA